MVEYLRMIKNRPRKTKQMTKIINSKKKIKTIRNNYPTQSDRAVNNSEIVLLKQIEHLTK